MRSSSVRVVNPVVLCATSPEVEQSSEISNQNHNAQVGVGRKGRPIGVMSEANSREIDKMVDNSVQKSHSKTVLIILHQMTSCPGAIGQWLKAQGYTLDIRRLRFGDLLPVTLENHCGVIVFGGPMSVNDPDDYIRYEIEWLKVPLRESKPLLGICLGAQMLVRHLGGQVMRHPQAHIEAGYLPVTPAQYGPALTHLPHWPSHFYQFHNEGFDLPSGASRLASSDLFENQAYSYGERAFGFQFHPEVTLAIIHRWTICGAARLSCQGASKGASQGAPFDSRTYIDKRAHVEAHLSHGTAIRQWLDQFMRHWLRDL